MVVSKLWLAGAQLEGIAGASEQPAQQQQERRQQRQRRAPGGSGSAGSGSWGWSGGSGEWQAGELRQALEAQVSPAVVDLLCQSIDLNSTASIYLNGEGALAST